VLAGVLGGCRDALQKRSVDQADGDRVDGVMAVILALLPGAALAEDGVGVKG
jgi:hypothetical protein